MHQFIRIPFMEPTSFKGSRWKKEMLRAIYMRRSPEIEDIQILRKEAAAKRNEK